MELATTEIWCKWSTKNTDERYLLRRRLAAETRKLVFGFSKKDIQLSWIFVMSHEKSGNINLDKLAKANDFG
jgi:hypothetical protein